MPSHYHTPLDSGARFAANAGSTQPYGVGMPSGNNVKLDWMTGSSGGGAAHNNMPPYQTVYVWQRTA